MLPSDVCNQCLALHSRIKSSIAQAASLAERARARETTSVATLRTQPDSLAMAIRQHVHAEQALLGPALMQTDAWGRERRRRLDEIHGTELSIVEATLRAPASPDAGELAGAVQRCAQRLSLLMAREERELLSPDVLRDDTIVINQIDG